jgi:hypothetical protein
MRFVATVVLHAHMRYVFCCIVVLGYRRETLPHFVYLIVRARPNPTVSFHRLWHHRNEMLALPRRIHYPFFSFLVRNEACLHTLCRRHLLCFASR